MCEVPETLEAERQERAMALVDSIRPFLNGEAFRMSLRMHVPASDLEAVGVHFAYRLALRYNPERGANFMTFAARWSKKAMLREAWKMGRAVHVPVHVKDQMAYQCYSMDAPLTTSADCERTLGDTMAAPENDELEENDRAGLVREALSMLSDTEAAVVMLRFFEDWTLQEVVERLGVSRERIRQIEYGALKRLRKFSGLEKMIRGGREV